MPFLKFAIFIFCVILFSCSISDNGKVNSPLAKIFNESDSVFLLSHNAPHRIALDVKTKSGGFQINSQQLLQLGQLNYKIIKEKKQIIQFNPLINILERKNEDSITHVNSCFDSYHSIVLFKDNKISYIDLSFQCLQWSSNNKETLNLIDLDRKGFDLLKSYFKENGFVKYMD